jgi:hypothetical protein
LQWGVLVTDNAPGSSSSSVSARSATFSFHQLLHGGETSLAAEYSMPLASPPGVLLLYNFPCLVHFLDQSNSPDQHCKEVWLVKTAKEMHWVCCSCVNSSLTSVAVHLHGVPVQQHSVLLWRITTML